MDIKNSEYIRKSGEKESIKPEFSEECVDAESSIESYRRYLREILDQDKKTLEPLFCELEAAGYPFERKPQKESRDSNSDSTQLAMPESHHPSE